MWPELSTRFEGSDVACANRALGGQFYGLCLARALKPMMWPVFNALAAANSIACTERALQLMFVLSLLAVAFLR